MNQLKLFTVIATAGMLAGCATNIDHANCKTKRWQFFYHNFGGRISPINPLEADYERDWVDANTYARKSF